MTEEQIKHLIRQTARKHGVNEDLALAVALQESGYQPKVTSSAGAIGVMQLMPKTAKDLGVQDPFDPVQNIDGGIRYLKAQLDAFKGDTSLALAAYNAGPGAVQEYGGIPPYAETQNYVKNILGSLQSSTGGFTKTAGSLLGHQTDNTKPVHTPITYEQHKAQEVASFGERFRHSFGDNSIPTAYNELLLAASNPIDNKWSPSQEDYQMLLDGLKDPTVAYNIAISANSPQHMMALLNERKEFEAMQEKIDNSPHGVESLGTLLGIILDPLNLVPMAGTGGKVFKLAKYAKIGAANALLNVADRATVERLTGRQEDLLMAGVFGGIGGMALPFAGDAVGAALGRYKGRATAVSQMFREKADIPNYKILSFNLNDVIERADHAFVRQFASKKLNDMFYNGKNFVLSRTEAEKLAKHLKQPFDDTKKAFNTEGYSFYVKEHIKTDTDMESLILHEQGVHEGLAKHMGEKAWEELKARITILSNNNPPATLLRAFNKAHGTDMEEVAGHWIEEIVAYNKKHPILSTVKKGINTTRKALGVNKDITEGEFESLVREANKVASDRARGYTPLEDGEALVNGIKYSATNPLNPRNIEEYNEIVNSNKPWHEKAADRLGKVFHKHAPFGSMSTPVSAFKNSKSKTLRGLADELFIDAQLTDRTHLKHIAIEEQRAVFKTELDEKYETLQKAIDEVCLEEGIKFGGMFDADRLEQINRNIVEFFDDEKLGKTVNPSPAQRKAIAAWEDYRKTQIDQGQHSGSRFGYEKNFITEGFKPKQDAIMRVYNEAKVDNFVALAPEGKAIDALTEGAYLSAQRFRASFKDDFVAFMEDNYQKALEKWKAAGSLGDAPTKQAFTEDALSDYIRGEARKYATGVIDGNTSSVKGGNDLNTGNGGLSFMQYRFPMDTKTQFQTPWGTNMCINDLRRYDFDNLCPNLNKRWAGEITLANYFNSKFKTNINALNHREVYENNIDNMRKLVKGELEQSKMRGEIGESRVKDDLAYFDYAIRKLRGVSDGEGLTVGDAIQQTLARFAYSSMSGNMAANQIGETGGSMGYNGVQALLDIVPGARKTLTEMHHGVDKLKLAEEIRRQVAGERLADDIFHNELPMSTGNYKRTLGRNSKAAGVLDSVDHIANLSAFIAAKWNGLKKLTHSMIKGAEGHIAIDIIDWLDGKEMWFLRRPFSEGKLKAAGIHPDSVAGFKDIVRKYIKRDASGKFEAFDFRKFWAEHPQEAGFFRQLIRNQSYRAIQQATIGNTNMLKESSAWWRAFFQFKNFTMMATQGQSLRALRHMEVDDAMALGWSLLTNCGVYTGLTIGRAYANHWDDDAAREEFINNRLSPEKLAMAAILRTPMTGAWASGLNDIWEVASGTPTIRTTSTNTRQGKSIFDEGGLAAAGGRTFGQLPTINMAAKAFTIPYALFEGVLTDENYMTQKNLSELYSLLPLQNFVLFQALKNELLEYLDIPEK